jgi:hypothetical protein
VFDWQGGGSLFQHRVAHYPLTFTIIDTLNQYGYQAMLGTTPATLPVSLEFLAYWVQTGSFMRSFNFTLPQQMQQSLTISSLLSILSTQSWKTAIERASHKEELLLPLKNFIGSTSYDHPPSMQDIANDLPNWFLQQPYTNMSWLSINQNTLQWEQDKQKYWDSKPCYRLKQGQEANWYTPQALEHEIDRVMNVSTFSMTFFVASFFSDLLNMLHALAANPIKENSGLVQPRKRKQINILTHPRETLTHPRKVIMHPQRTYQDVQKDIANQLSGFPNFTARVKISETAPQNPGKKCLSCKLLNNLGAKYCASCGKQLPAPNEYTLTTLKPLGGIGKAALLQRLTSIQGNNIQKGYVRDRTSIEAEIINRQTGCSSGSAPAQPQQPSPQQPRHARQVPVQEKCKNCGASNSPGAKFCNQCGTKLK